MGILNIDQDIISMKFTPSKAISVFMCNNTYIRYDHFQILINKNKA